jgi:nucleotide-binding universal stress UspA family protein
MWVSGRGRMSLVIKRVLFATDFSACSEQARQWASFLGKRFGSSIDVIHVLEFNPGMKEESPVAKIYLDHYHKEFGQQLESLKILLQNEIKEVFSHQRVGLPVDEICRFAQKENSDLIVLGTHGWSGIDRVLLGSTAERVVRGAPCPVVTVRLKDPGEGKTLHREQKAEGTDGVPSLKRFLIPVDFSDCSLEAMEYGIEIAKLFGAQVVLLHVTEPRGYGIGFTLSHHSKDEEIHLDLEKRLKEYVRVFQSQGLQIDYRLEGGFPVDQILEESNQFPPDLIVMGTHGRKGFSKFVSGSVAEAVLRHSPCPVLTLKSPKYTPV